MRNSSEVIKEIVEKHNYHVVIGRNVITEIPSLLGDNVYPHLALIGKNIANSNKWISEELSRTFESVWIIEDGESSKDLDTVLLIIEKLWKLRASRWSAIACVAGGSLGDTAAFAASIYLRGIPFVNIPTTLLAMIDSSIGGKTAVNYKGIKNIIGSFYHPSLVVDDIRFLDTLPKRVYLSSLAESLKYGFTLDRDFLQFLLNNKDSILSRSEDDVLINLISRSVELKLDVVGLDPRERSGIREVLNYGHTVGHVIESASRYKLFHGEAVALGMIVETELSEKLGCNGCSDVVKEAIESYGILKSPEVKSSVPNLAFEEYRELLYRDKKRVGNKIRWPMLTSIGSWKLVTLDFDIFAKSTYEIYKSVLKEFQT